jgi:hypothetical protein
MPRPRSTRTVAGVQVVPQRQRQLDHDVDDEQRAERATHRRRSARRGAAPAIERARRRPATTTAPATRAAARSGGKNTSDRGGHDQREHADVEEVAGDQRGSRRQRPRRRSRRVRPHEEPRRRSSGRTRSRPSSSRTPPSCSSSHAPMTGVSVRADSQMLSGCACRSQSALQLGEPGEHVDARRPGTAGAQSVHAGTTSRRADGCAPRVDRPARVHGAAPTSSPAEDAPPGSGG